MHSKKTLIKNLELYCIMDSIKNEIDGEPNPNILLNHYDNFIRNVLRFINNPEKCIETPDEAHFASLICCEQEIKDFLEGFISFDKYSIQELRTLYNLFSKIDNLTDGVIY